MPRSCQSLVPLLEKSEMPVVDSIVTRSEISHSMLASICEYCDLFHCRQRSSQSGFGSSRKHQSGIE